jgi:nicotinamide phosphoribosyltransferase
MMTITNTHPDFGWLVNYLETLISCMLWQPVTSATIAHEYKKILDKYALETTGNTEGVQWQGHDFSMRGMSSVESAIISGMGHLLSFTGTDIIPAIYQLESSYMAKGLIGASVPATEHSVMCMGTKESEIDTFKRLLNLYPSGILSVVSDTWDLWKVCTEYLPALKSEIRARDGKLVIRPDSGNPVDIICGMFIYDNPEHWNRIDKQYDRKSYEAKDKGVIELLWDIFGGTINAQGYKVLDPHIGAIYGDSITLERATEICERLKAKGFASTNIVLGIGSYTYQYNTRDTFGFAMKATYGEITHPPVKGGSFETDSYVEAREIFKDPITDDGTKKSKKGLLQVDLFEKHNGNCDMMGCDMNGCIGICKELSVKDQCTWKEEQLGLLTTVFKDGKLVKETTLDEIRNRLNGK